MARFVERIRHLYPGCPSDRPEEIATYACQKYSGRVGRSAAAKRLDEEAVRPAVATHVRHHETRYEELLARGLERWDARDQVRAQVDRVLARWAKRSDEGPGLFVRRRGCVSYKHTDRPAQMRTCIACGVQAARRSYRWCKPPTCGIATMLPSPGPVTG